MVSPSAARVGRRIRAERERSGLTQAAVAAALGKTPTAVSYWESGQRSPGLDDLAQLARLLGVPVTALLPSQPPKVLARAHAAEVAISELSAVVDRLVDRYEGAAPFDGRAFTPATNPAELADIVRLEAGQTRPPIDVRTVISTCNVRFSEEEMPTALSGLVVVVDDTPAIAVRRQDPPRRRRFTAAHELGHVLLVHHDTFHVDLTAAEGVPPNYNWRHERAANDFAAAVLMPAALLRDDVSTTVPVTTRALADRYDVSEQAMSIRLTALGIRLWAGQDDQLF
jgi:Zn-dependent peptidase ImmA (M78 family)/transcriptional regulator with XRE-family HTH domain